MIDKEHKIIKLSILVLCFALVFVYLVWFYVKWEQLHILNTATGTTSSNTINPRKGISDKKVTNSIITDDKKIEGKTQKEQEKNIKNTQIKQDEKSKQGTKQTVIVENNDDFFPKTLTEKKILSGTQHINDGIDAVDVLWIVYKYALRDKKGIEYMYLWQGINNDFVEIVKQYDGTIHTIESEYDLKKNMLFWDRILFINIPAYKNNLVLMVVKYNDDYWLIKIKHSLYYSSKKYLKDLFTD